MSAQHSSPRSDAASASGHAAAPVPTVASAADGAALQTSDVVIHRKENEGFGFVIISSLNRPENATVISEWLPSAARGDLSAYVTRYYFLRALSSIMLGDVVYVYYLVW